MTRQFYSNVIFFLGLTVVVGLLHSLLYANVGINLFTLPTFASLFLTGTLISLVSTVFLLHYFYKQHYWAAFVTGSLACLAAVGRATLAYIHLVPITRAFESYYIPSFFLDIGAGLLYAGSLVFSETGKSPWLKAAGLAYTLLGLSALATLIWSMQAHLVAGNPTLKTIEQWLSIVGSLLPLLLIGYFWQQQQQVSSAKTDSPASSGQEILVGLLRFMAIGALLVFGVSLMGEGIRASRPSAKAQEMTRLFEPHTFVSQRGDTMQYRLLKPAGYDSTQHYPLVLSLHGGAGYGTDNTRQLDNWEVQKLAEPENRKKYPAFIVAPQCSRGSSWGGLPKLIAKDTLVIELVKALEKELSIDTNRRYVVGGSLGGYGAWHFAGTYPGMFAAAVPMCGGGNPALAKKMTGVAIWAFHGEKDRNVPVEGSRDVIDAIKKEGGSPRYTEFPGVKHNLWPELKNIPDILDWLFAQKRDGQV